jgi:hypothetical protein
MPGIVLSFRHIINIFLPLEAFPLGIESESRVLFSCCDICGTLRIWIRQCKLFGDSKVQAWSLEYPRVLYRPLKSFMLK